MVTEPQPAPQDRADQAAKDLMTAITEMAVPGDSEIVVLLRGHVEGIPGREPPDADLFYSWEWFCRPEDRSGLDVAPGADGHGHIRGSGDEPGTT